MENELLALNFGIDDGAGTKFGTLKELILFNIFKNYYRINKSRDMSLDHLAKNRK